MTMVGGSVVCPRAVSDDDILLSLRAGEPILVRGRSVLVSEPFAWSPCFLSSVFPHAPVSCHTSFDGTLFRPAVTEMSAFISQLPPQSAVPEMTPIQRRSHYAVVNARRLHRGPLLMGRLRNVHRNELAYLWLGLSPGGLHCDYFNNVLIQLYGRKRATVVPAQYSAILGGSHYVSLPDPAHAFAKANVEANKALARVSYTDVELAPGDAVVIPSTAYHSVQALTVDSVSLNVFVTPQTLRVVLKGVLGFHSYLSPFARKEDRWPWLVTNATIATSRLFFDICGRPLLSTGHYEVI